MGDNMVEPASPTTIKPLAFPITAVVLPAVEPLPALSELQAHQWTRLMKIKGVQTLAFALLISIGGMLIFSDSFVGTGTNLGVAFFWGFFTDIGVDELKTITGNIRNPAK